MVGAMSHSHRNDELSVIHIPEDCLDKAEPGPAASDAAVLSPATDPVADIADFTDEATVDPACPEAAPLSSEPC